MRAQLFCFLVGFLLRIIPGEVFRLPLLVADQHAPPAEAGVRHIWFRLPVLELGIQLVDPLAYRLTQDRITNPGDADVYNRLNLTESHIRPHPFCDGFGECAVELRPSDLPQPDLVPLVREAHQVISDLRVHLLRLLRKPPRANDPRVQSKHALAWVVRIGLDCRHPPPALRFVKEQLRQLGRLILREFEGPVFNRLVRNLDPLMPIRHPVPQGLAFLQHARNVLVQGDQLIRPEHLREECVEPPDRVRHLPAERRAEPLPKPVQPCRETVQVDLEVLRLFRRSDGLAVGKIRELDANVSRVVFLPLQPVGHVFVEPVQLDRPQPFGLADVPHGVEQHAKLYWCRLARSHFAGVVAKERVQPAVPLHAEFDLIHPERIHHPAGDRTALDILAIPVVEERVPKLQHVPPVRVRVPEMPRVQQGLPKLRVFHQPGQLVKAKRSDLRPQREPDLAPQPLRVIDERVPRILRRKKGRVPPQHPGLVVLHRRQQVRQLRQHALRHQLLPGGFDFRGRVESFQATLLNGNVVHPLRKCRAGSERGVNRRPHLPHGVDQTLEEVLVLLSDAQAGESVLHALVRHPLGEAEPVVGTIPPVGGNAKRRDSLCFHDQERAGLVYSYSVPHLGIRKYPFSRRRTKQSLDHLASRVPRVGRKG